MKNLAKFFLTLLTVAPGVSYADSNYNCQGFICSLNVSPSEIKDYFQCPGPDYPIQQFVTFGFGSGFGSQSERFEPPFFGGSFYQSIQFDANFQPPEKLELKAFDQYECSEMQNKYEDLFSFVFESDWHFRFPDPSYTDRFAVLGNKIYTVKVVNSFFNSSNSICTLETDYKNRNFSETFSAQNGDGNFRVRFININEKIIYTNNNPKILELFKSNISLKVAGIR